jgi:hypothetical protein
MRRIEVEAFPCGKCGANHWVLRADGGSLFHQPRDIQETLMAPIKAACLMFNEQGGFTKFQLANCARCNIATVVPWHDGNMEVRAGRFYVSGTEL